MPNQTMVYSCSAPEQEYTMVWFGIFLYLLISSLKIRFCEQSVFAKSPLPENAIWIDPAICSLLGPVLVSHLGQILSLFLFDKIV